MRTSALAALVALLAVPTAAAGSVTADGPGESTEAAQLVRQAVALIVNTAGNGAGIEDKVADALTAPDQQGVDPALVRQAQAALQSGNLHDARALLERSIGARPHLGTSDPLPIGQSGGTPGMPMATGAQPGTDVAVDALAPDRSRSAGDWWALAGLAALAGAGRWLAARFGPRPHMATEVRT